MQLYNLSEYVKILKSFFTRNFDPFSVYLIINTRSASSESESLSKDSTDNRISGDSQSEGQLSLDVPDSR